MANQENPRTETAYSPLFVTFFGIFIASLLVSNVIAGRLFVLFGVALPSAVILFPVTYILSDIFTEVYGFEKTKRVIWGGFLANLLMSVVFLIALRLPAPDFFTATEAYSVVLGMTPRVVLASLLGYWAGEFGNSISLSILKVATKGRHLWTRTIASTIVGQGLDTVLFIGIAFGGAMPLEALLGMMVAQYLFKVGYEVIFTPLTYAVIRAVKRREGIDAYDRGVAYNPFRFGEKR